MKVRRPNGECLRRVRSNLPLKLGRGVGDAVFLFLFFFLFFVLFFFVCLFVCLFVLIMVYQKQRKERDELRGS